MTFYSFIIDMSQQGYSFSFMKKIFAKLQLVSVSQYLGFFDNSEEWRKDIQLTLTKTQTYKAKPKKKKNRYKTESF